MSNLRNWNSVLLSLTERNILHICLPGLCGLHGFLASSLLAFLEGEQPVLKPILKSSVQF